MAPETWRPGAALLAIALLSIVVTACSGTSSPGSSSSIPTPTSSTDTTSPPTSAPPETTTTTLPTTTTEPEPEFAYTIDDVDAERLAHSWTPDCPVAPEDVVLIELNHWDFDGRVREGAIVVAREEGENVAAIFDTLFEIGYPIASVIPIGDLPPGIEDAEPDYNNTSGLHCRRATGSTRWSDHARGLAIDINPLLNPFVTSRTLWPAGSERYLDRTLGEPGMIVADDDVVSAFEERGWLWGGYWESIKDYHHFSTTGR